MKKCRKCGVLKPLEDFYRLAGMRDGHRHDCKTCNLEAQGGGCFICGRPPREDISLHVDHDHSTGTIRGILCFRCNNALADFQEDPGLLAKAAAYLDRNTYAEEIELARRRALSLVGR